MELVVLTVKTHHKTSGNQKHEVRKSEVIYFSKLGSIMLWGPIIMHMKFSIKVSAVFFPLCSLEDHHPTPK